MQVMMIPCDSFSHLRVGVFDGAHGEDITPPIEKGDPKTGWFILGMGAAQCITYEEADSEEPIPTVDRAVFVVFGRPKPEALAQVTQTDSGTPVVQEPETEAAADAPPPEPSEETKA